MVFISRLRLRNFKSFKAANIQLPKTYIVFAGPNGSGKCVDGETEIFLADGSAARIRDLIDEAMARGHVEEMDDGYIAQYAESPEIFSLDTKTLKTVRKKIAAFVKRKAPQKMLRVRTRSGREITATEYHPFFILENDTIVPIRADRLKEGIRIAIPRRLPAPSNDETFLELLDGITIKDNVYIPYDEKTANIIRCKKGGRNWRNLEAEACVPEKTLNSFVSSQQSLLFPYLIRTLRYCGMDDLEIADRIRFVKSQGGETLLMQWRNSNEFCRFLGYLLAEGSVSRSNNQIRFTNGSEEVVADFVGITKKLFGLEPHVYKYKKGSYDVIINSVILRNILLKFGMSFDGSAGKTVPEMVFRHSTNENLANLLSGLYSGDGYVSKNSIELTLKSEKLIRAVERIILRLGIVPRTRRITKRETKSGFVGSYLKVSIFGGDNALTFSRAVKLAHKEKNGRLSRLPDRKINPNVDLIEANSLVKKAAQDLGINVKITKRKFPRLDAYCYNQCLPSRYGLRHIMSELIRPVVLQKSMESESVATLQLLSESDIFWDEIESIEKTKPREEWVYDLSISEHHNFIANGIFVHNSNLCDAIRFAMGETSLKSLRAKKVKDLIHTGARSAEVTLTFDEDGSGGTAYEIKRAIREDGKILYRLNGRKTTRSAILEALKKYNLDESGRNTIAQGEVQRIISMQGKERRTIIDSVAGIADFEEKKKEAMHELETVETRIKDANLVLGERRAFLDELARDKETALRYMDAKKKLTNAKGTLLKREVKRLEGDLEDATSNEEKLLFNRKNKEQEISGIDARMKELDAKRMAASQELQSKQKTSGLIRKVEELKASCASKAQLVEDREGFLKKMKTEREGLAKELASEEASIDALKSEIDKLHSELKASESKLAAYGGSDEDEGVARIRRLLEEQEAELARTKEALIGISSEISSKKEIIEAKMGEEKGIKLPAGAEEQDAASEEMKRLAKEAARISDDIEQLFSKTKEINADMGRLDREMLELKEKASIYKVRTSAQLANPALSFINDLKAKDPSIYGTVADLVSFDQKHSSAVEAAGGARLLYVIVDSVDTATKTIEKLKKARCGRATFIPLDAIRTPPMAKANGFSSVLEVVEFPDRIRRAVEYVFADTLLVDSVADAKKLGVGTGRMVTLEGEIFERSGIVSGGRSESGLLAANQMKKIEKELADVRSAKESMLQELYSIRETESRLRAEKSQIEIKIKTIEMEHRVAEERRKESEHLVQRKMKLLEEISSLEKTIGERERDREKLSALLGEHESGIKSVREKLKSAEEGFRKQSEESSKRMAELSADVSSFRATIEGKLKELELRKKERFVKEERLKQLEKDEKATLQNINEVKRQARADQESLSKLEEQITSASREIEKLFELMKSYEDGFADIGKELATRRIELDKFVKDLGQLDVKKATVTTRLDDLRVELANYQEVEILDMKKDELTKTIAESERTLAEMGNVNMAAIEMYEKRKAEITEAEERIAKLDDERQAIMSMIAEIEEHKKEAFFETFEAVSDNFSKMFKHINIGDGHLYLDKPATPFESGLFIKIRRHNMEYSLDALSGGEKTLVALMFIFALQFFKPAPFYILDEVDAALDKPNSKNLAELVYKMTGDSQFILVSHNDTVMSNADSVIGVAKADGTSKLVGVKLKQIAAA